MGQYQSPDSFLAKLVLLVKAKILTFSSKLLVSIDTRVLEYKGPINTFILLSKNSLNASLVVLVPAFVSLINNFIFYYLFEKALILEH